MAFLDLRTFRRNASADFVTKVDFMQLCDGAWHNKQQLLGLAAERQCALRIWRLHLEVQRTAAATSTPLHGASLVQTISALLH